MPHDDDVLLARRRQAARALASAAQEHAPGAPPAVVLVCAGAPVRIPGGHDQRYPFLSHADYFHLADRECVGGVLACDLADAGGPDGGGPDGGGENPWRDFEPAVTDAERTWEGDRVAIGRPLAELAAWMASRADRPLAVLGSPGAAFTQAADTKLTLALGEALLHARRVLDEGAISRMRDAASATAAGHAVARAIAADGGRGLSERGARIEIEAAMFRAGGDATAYDTIVGCGPGAAVLHATPGERRLEQGSCVLVDAGASVGRYAADVTRTWAIGRASEAQRGAIALVTRAERAAVDACRPGVEWHDVHRLACRSILEGLAGMGVVRDSAVRAGGADGLIDRGLAALLMPHGVGHMIGLGVRGAGGREPGRAPRPGPGGVRVRVDLPLRAGYAMTVEPGLYFIGRLLEGVRERFEDAVDWASLERLAGEIRGVRIEDDVVVRADGPPLVLTDPIAHADGEGDGSGGSEARG